MVKHRITTNATSLAIGDDGNVVTNYYWASNEDATDMIKAIRVQFPA